MYHSSLQITILTIVPGKPKMCLQESLVDCADCGGLNLIQLYSTVHESFKFPKQAIVLKKRGILLETKGHMKVSNTFVGNATIKQLCR